MLKINEILSFYPKNLHIFKKFIYKEYLQYLILKIIFESKFASKLRFLGGTALRIIFDNQRFSEDLDFDNIGLTKNEFAELSEIIKLNLEKIGYQVEIQNVYKGVFRCNIKIPKILKTLGFSNYDSEKILIQVDTVAQTFEYVSISKILNKFGLVFTVNIAPLDIITSQKIYAIFNRNRPKGRDFYDLIFLLAKCSPNIDYIKSKLGYSSIKETYNNLLDFCEKLDFNELVDDVKIFLFDETGKNNLIYFKDIIKDNLSKLAEKK